MSLAGFRVDCSVLVGACGVTFLINGISLSGRDSLTFVNLNARVAALHETQASSEKVAHANKRRRLLRHETEFALKQTLVDAYISLLQPL